MDARACRLCGGRAGYNAHTAGKDVVGQDYITQGEWKKRVKAMPGVACITLASSALRAVQFGKSVDDERPVGKLFSKFDAGKVP